MEEKERYELTDTDCILDTERDVVISDICDVITTAEEIRQLKQSQNQLALRVLNELKEDAYVNETWSCVQVESWIEEKIDNIMTELKGEE